MCENHIAMMSSTNLKDPPKKKQKTGGDEFKTNEEPALGTHRRLTDVEHLLSRPDTFIGSLRPVTQMRRLVLTSELADSLGLSLDYVAAGGKRRSLTEKNSGIAVPSNDIDKFLVEESLGDDVKDSETLITAISNTAAVDEEPGALKPAKESKLKAKAVTKTQKRAAYRTLNVKSVFSLALQGCVQELIANAADAAFRDSSVNKISVEVDRKLGCITVSNTGNGIPVKKTAHSGDKWVASCCVSDFRFSSNFGDKSKDASRFMGVVGRNGYGSKIANGLSSRFELTTHDVIEGKILRQVWTNNIGQTEGPKVTSKKGKRGFTTIKMFPDLARFGLKEITPAIEASIHTLTWETAACLTTLGRKLPIYFNQCKLPIDTVQDFTSVFFNLPVGTSIAADIVNDAVTGFPSLIIAAAPQNSSDNGSVLSGSGTELTAGTIDVTAGGSRYAFVNSIPCHSGTHVGLVVDQLAILTKTFLPKGLSGRKSLTSLIKRAINSCMALTIIAVLPDPEFDDQRKTVLSSPMSVEWKPSSKFKTALKTSGITDAIVGKVSEIEDRKTAAEERKTAKELQGSVVGGRRAVNVPKLDDAPNAGKLLGSITLPDGRRVRAPTAWLHIAEGDSAKAMIMAGFGALKRLPRDKCGEIAPGVSASRDDHGAFPLKGKPENIYDIIHKNKTALEKARKRNRKAPKPKKLPLDNEEIKNLAKSLGIAPGVDYSTPEGIASLRYAGIFIDSDQDEDGFHIRGLLIADLFALVPSLLKSLSGFIRVFNTPVVEMVHKTRKNTYLEFMALEAHKTWMRDTEESEKRRWRPIYKKGLGTSSDKDAKRYMRTLGAHSYKVVFDEEAAESINVMFGPDSDKRKFALKNRLNLSDTVDTTAEEVTVTDIMYKEVLVYFFADVQRSLPSLDGNVHLQRIIATYASGHLPVNSSVKVSVIAGAATKALSYHHGEASMCGGISVAGRSHKFGNNVNGLKPQGQCGSQHANPKKSTASPRYLEMSKRPILDALMCTQDSAFLPKRVTEDGDAEPLCFAPAVPGLLINGAMGAVGSGFSCKAPPFNLRDLIRVQRGILQKTMAFKDANELVPFWQDFEGEVVLRSRTPIENVVGVDGNLGCFEDLQYTAYGSYTIGKNVKGVTTVFVTEMTPGTWSSEWQTEMLKTQRIGSASADSKAFIKTIVAACGGTVTKFELLCDTALLQPLLDEVDERGRHPQLINALKLSKSFSMSNMHLVMPDTSVIKCHDLSEVFKLYQPHKYEALRLRKAHFMDALPRQIAKLEAQIIFLRMLNAGEIVLFRRKRKDVIDDLKTAGLPFDGYVDGYDEGPQTGIPNFKYLLSLRTEAMLEDEDAEHTVASKSKKMEHLKKTLDELTAKSLEDLWLEDLQVLEEAHTKYLTDRLEEGADDED